ncbi:hypothetical protein [Agrobacterium tumefaciens]|uniref:hypothetical protein n=1 Tax=Agrobacterium tumefaciens TaxID=358 RepID=UPI0009757ED2|nr:hypothetical protein [Agrobacterium tumefaciens]MRH98844.1 hypothetical protein [Agrobacterium tumefaciens]OMP69383.1 hypothetical protein BV900_25360 [Agrobacterium tumefaciens]
MRLTKPQRFRYLAPYGRNNFELNPAIAIRDIYRLFLVFSGDVQFFELTSSPDDPLRLMRDDHFADEITHLLIGTAVANRIHAEHMSHLRVDPRELKHQPITVQCGSLQPDILNSSREIPLTFEQACNKIIHAVHIVPDCGNPAENPLSSDVKLRGFLGKSAWSAYLNIPQYVRASILNFRDCT